MWLDSASVGQVCLQGAVEGKGVMGEGSGLGLARLDSTIGLDKGSGTEACESSVYKSLILVKSNSGKCTP